MCEGVNTGERTRPASPPPHMVTFKQNPQWQKVSSDSEANGDVRKAAG